MSGSWNQQGRDRFFFVVKIFNFKIVLQTEDENKQKARHMKSNSCTKPFAEFIRKNSHIELGNERINDTLHSFIKLHHPENSNEKSRNSSYVNESEEMGREGERVLFECYSEWWYLWRVILSKAYTKILYSCLFENFDTVVCSLRAKIVQMIVGKCYSIKSCKTDEKYRIRRVMLKWTQI